MSNCQGLLRNLAPKPRAATRHEESFLFHDDRLISMLEISKKGELPHTILMGIPESLGIVALKVTSKSRTGFGETTLDFGIEASVELGKGEKVLPLGKARLRIDTKASTVKVTDTAGKQTDPFLKKKIDWGNLVDCVRSSCIGWVCGLSTWVCFGCIAYCVVDSIVDD